GSPGQLRPAREAVDDAAHLACSLLLEKPRRLGVRLACVDDQRQPDVTSEPNLAPEHLALRVARRIVVVEVEPDLPDRHDPPLARETADLAVGRLGRELRL